MYLKNSIYVILFSVLLYSCANIVTPEGGKKDVKPPFAISSEPKDSLLNFHGSKIIIYFNENIQIKDQKNIIISPSIKNGFEAEAYKKKLTLKLKNLQLNTTYTINATNAIADITEGNLLPSLKFIFSTGNTIDTAFVQGQVIDANTLKPIKNTSVCLYRNYTDSSLLKDDPDYMTITDINGSFVIENIKATSYKLVALEDKNNNKRWEEGENLAFLKDNIKVDSFKRHLLLRQFKQHKKDYVVSAISNSDGIYEFVFDKLSDDIIINQEDPSLDKKENYYSLTKTNDCDYSGIKKDVITSLNPKDSAHFNYQIKNTLYKKAIKVSKNKPFFQTVFSSYNIPAGNNSIIPFNRMIDTNSIDRAKIILKKDTILLNNRLMNLSPYGFSMPKAVPGIYKITFLSGALMDISGFKNDSFEVIVRLIAEDDLQTLLLKTDSSFQRKYQLVITNEMDYCKRETVQANSSYTLTKLVPGLYKVMVYDDKNANNYFDNGDFFLNIIPEKMVYYKEIEIKKSFDIEETMSIIFN